jgi:hypothetical protein
MDPLDPGMPATVVTILARLKVLPSCRTVKVVDPTLLPVSVDDVAVIVVKPLANPIAKPLEPVALLMRATDVVVEFQVTELVMSFLVLSEKVPIALNCLLPFIEIEGFRGVMSIEVSTTPFEDSEFVHANKPSPIRIQINACAKRFFIYTPPFSTELIIVVCLI